MSQSFKEFIKYGVVGVVGLAIEWGVYFLLRDVLDFHYLIAHIVGSVLAITNNFVLNSYFTFKTTDQIKKRAIYYFGIAAVGIIVSSTLLPIFVRLINMIWVNIELFELSEKSIQNIAKLMATVIVTLLQFFLNKYFTFKKKNA